MDEITLSNGVVMPTLGYGTFPQKEELLSTLPYAWKCGYKLFDTSDDYHNMSYIGEFVESSEEYKNAFIVTKISWPFDPADIQSLITEYKKSLGLRDRCIDLLLLHFPYPYLYMETWKQMEQLYLEGTCRAIGVCNFEVEHLEYLMKHCKITLMVNQIELHPMFQQKELCEFCQNNNIAIMSYSPVARMNNRLAGNNVLSSLADKYEKSVSQVVLRWNIQHGYIPIPSSSNAEHIKSNIEVFDFELNDEEIEKIDGLDCGMRIRFNPNTMFGVKWSLKCLMVRCGMKNLLNDFKKKI